MYLYMYISGSILGIMVGSLTLLILKLAPVSMDELKEWQANSQKERDEYVYKYAV